MHTLYSWNYDTLSKTSFHGNVAWKDFKQSVPHITSPTAAIQIASALFPCRCLGAVPCIGDARVNPPDSHQQSAGRTHITDFTTIYTSNTSPEDTSMCQISTVDQQSLHAPAFHSHTYSSPPVQCCPSVSEIHRLVTKRILMRISINMQYHKAQHCSSSISLLNGITAQRCSGFAKQN